MDSPKIVTVAEDTHRHLIGTGWHPNEEFISVRQNGREVYRQVTHHFARLGEVLNKQCKHQWVPEYPHGSKDIKVCELCGTKP